MPVSVSVCVDMFMYTYIYGRWQDNLQFAGKTARQKDNRWSNLILDWQPDFGLGCFQGRPKKRWSDDIVAYVGGNWIELANDVNLWSSLEDGYVLRLW